MQPERWARLQEIYLDALELPERDRADFVRSAAGGDEELRDEVLELLESEGRPDPLLASSLDDLVGLIEDEEQPAPERAGPYRIVGVLGYGGMGAVYRAEREEVDRTVALKLLAGWLTSPVSTARFEREQQILARLEHPNIARLYDAGVTDEGRPYLGMELVEGEPIHSYCDRRQLGVAERLRLFEQVCAAVEYAHRKLVIHRDLKPSNILVTEDGRVKLLDFGIAKLLGGPGDASSEPLTRNTRILTPEYASPEQLLGEELGTASDVYSLGVVLHRLLTGRYPRREDGRTITRSPSTLVAEPDPADGDSPEEIARARGSEPARLSRTLRGDLDTILLKAMRFEPEERYPSVTALLDDLVRLREGRPITARAPSRAYRLGKFVRRNRAAVAAAALFIVTLTTGVLALARQQAETLRERDRAELEAERANQVTSFMESMFDAASPARARGDSVTVREVVELAAARVTTEMAGRPHLQMRLLSSLGNVYGSLGLIEQSRATLEDAVTISESIDDPDLPVLANIYNDLGNVVIDQMGFEEAEEHLLRAMEIRRQALPEDDIQLGASALNLGLNYTYAGRLDEADPLLREALRIDSLNMVGDTSTPVGYALNNLGLLRYHQGRLDEAADLWEEALAHRRRTHGRLHPRTVTSLSNLGTLLGIMGEIERSLPVLEESVEVQRALHGQAHPDLANTLGNYASTLQMAGRPDEAERIAREALELNRTVFDEPHSEIAANLNLLGLIEDDRGNHDAALPLKLAALEMVRAVLDPLHQRVAMQAQSTATTYAALDRCDLAEPLFLEALEAYPHSQPEDGFRMAYARAGYARCLVAAGRFQEAEDLLLPSYDLLLESNGPDNFRTRTAREGLVELYEAWGRPQAADVYRQNG